MYVENIKVSHEYCRIVGFKIVPSVDAFVSAAQSLFSPNNLSESVMNEKDMALVDLREKLILIL